MSIGRWRSDWSAGEVISVDIVVDGRDIGADGICLDARDAVWYADVPNQRCVRVAEGGAVLPARLAGRPVIS